MTAAGRRAFLRHLPAGITACGLSGGAAHRSLTARLTAGLAAAGAAVGGLCPRAATARAPVPVPWLDEVQRPPPGFAAGAVPPLPPLVPGNPGDPGDPGDPAATGTADAAPPTWDTWPEHRGRIERAWLDLLGPMPPPPPLAAEVLREDEVEGCRRQLVRYACEADLPAEAYLLFPPGDVPGPLALGRPGVVALHSTTDSTNECIAGLRDGPDRRLGVELARRGFVTVCPRCFLWQDRAGYAEQVRRFRARHPGALGVRKMLHDAARAVDLLATTAGVDADRIGCVGHSLGAKEALYLAAFDRRIRATVAHDGGLGRRQSNWEAEWYLGPGVPAGFDHHQLLALAAPRAVLVQGGGPGAADGAASWPLVAAALTVYRLHPGPAAVGLDVHGGGHRLTDRAVTRLVEWLAAFLGA